MNPHVPDDIRRKAADLAKPLRDVGARIESDFREDVERALMDERGRHPVGLDIKNGVIQP